MYLFCTKVLKPGVYFIQTAHLSLDIKLSSDILNLL